MDYGAFICAEELAVLKRAEMDSILRERGFGQRLCGRPGFPATLYDTVAKIALSSRVPKDGDVSAVSGTSVVRLGWICL